MHLFVLLLFLLLLLLLLGADGGVTAQTRLQRGRCFVVVVFLTENVCLSYLNHKQATVTSRRRIHFSTGQLFDQAGPCSSAYPFFTPVLPSLCGIFHELVNWLMPIQPSIQVSEWRAADRWRSAPNRVTEADGLIGVQLPP